MNRVGRNHVADKRKERLNLLCHLLRLGGKYTGYDFDVRNLRESTRDVVGLNLAHFQEGATDILNDIYNCRTKEEEYERGEIGTFKCPLLFAIVP